MNIKKIGVFLHSESSYLGNVASSHLATLLGTDCHGEGNRRRTGPQVPGAPRRRRASLPRPAPAASCAVCCQLRAASCVWCCVLPVVCALELVRCVWRVVRCVLPVVSVQRALCCVQQVVCCVLLGVCSVLQVVGCVLRVVGCVLTPGGCRKPGH